MGGSHTKEAGAGAGFGGVVPGTAAPVPKVSKKGVSSNGIGERSPSEEAVMVASVPAAGASQAPKNEGGLPTVRLRESVLTSTGAAAGTESAAPGLATSRMSFEEPLPTSRVDQPDECTGGKQGIALNNISAAQGILGETERKTLKLSKVENVLSEVIPSFLYVSGVNVSRNLQQLQESKITHIINCSGDNCEDCFPEHFEYVTLCIADAKTERIDPYFSSVVEFIDTVRRLEGGGGRVLVHCWQGVSRSVSFVVAYLMWKQSVDFNSARDIVRRVRNVARPNLAFQCQLTEWHRLRLQTKEQVEPRLYAIIHAKQVKSGLCKTVLRLCLKVNSMSPCVPAVNRLDERGIFLLYAPPLPADGAPNSCRMFVWHGEACEDAYVLACLNGLSDVGKSLLSMQKSGDNASAVYLGTKHVDKIQEPVTVGADSDHDAFWSVLNGGDVSQINNRMVGQCTEFDQIYGPEQSGSADCAKAPKPVVAAEEPNESGGLQGPNAGDLEETITLYKYTGAQGTFEGNKWEELFAYEWEDLGPQDESEDIFLLASNLSEAYFFIGSKCDFAFYTNNAKEESIQKLLTGSTIETKVYTKGAGENSEINIVFESAGLGEKFCDFFEKGM